MALARSALAKLFGEEDDRQGGTCDCPDHGSDVPNRHGDP